MREKSNSNGLTLAFVAVAACLLYAISGGIRANYGILLKGISESSGLTYASVSFVLAISQLMYGITQPLFGVLAIKKSNAFALCLGTLLVLAGLLMIPLCTSVWSLMVFLGILMPSGFGAISFGIIMGAVTPVLGQKRAAVVSGIVSASSGLGSVALSPLISALLTKAGLLSCIVALSIPTICLIPISILLSRVGQETALNRREEVFIKSMLVDAFSNKSYYLLLFAFFTCGFHMAIIETHLFSNMTASGISDTVASYIFSLYGITTMIGSILTGALGTRFPMKWIAAITFSSRLFIIATFLILPKTSLTFAGFALLLGLTGSATVPPVSGMIGKLFGSASLATLFGILFISHQIGSFFSVWLGGINFKSYSKSYKMKRRIENPEENRAIFLNVHEAIIDRPTWEKVQALKSGTRRKRPSVTQEPSVFSGLLKCSECGGNLNFHFNQGNHDIKFFSCQNHNSGLRKCSATHYIRLDFLEQVVLYEVNRLACFANEYEGDFIKAMMGRSAKVAENDRARKQRELDGLLARDKELDMLFERLYEDNVCGKIDDARFSKMSKRYEQEQGENAAKVKALKLELKKTEGKRMDIDQFLESVRRYTNAAKVTKRMVTELIDHIEVYHAEKDGDGVATQRVTIFYNCIGAFDVPDRRKIPEVDILMETRKGVAVNYAPAQTA